MREQGNKHGGRAEVLKRTGRWDGLWVDDETRQGLSASAEKGERYAQTEKIDEMRASSRWGDNSEARALGGMVRARRRRRGGRSGMSRGLNQLS